MTIVERIENYLNEGLERHVDDVLTQNDINRDEWYWDKGLHIDNIEVGKEIANLLNNTGDFNCSYDKKKKMIIFKPLKESINERLANRCAGKVFAFTGFRDAQMEQDIEEQGGEVSNGITTQTTHLIMKKKGSGSIKEEKAKERGLVIWDEKEMNKFLTGGASIPTAPARKTGPVGKGSRPRKIKDTDDGEGE